MKIETNSLFKGRYKPSLTVAITVSLTTSASHFLEPKIIKVKMIKIYKDICRKSTDIFLSISLNIYVSFTTYVLIQK